MSTRGRLHDRRKRCLFSTAQPAGCERLPGLVIAAFARSGGTHEGSAESFVHHDIVLTNSGPVPPQKGHVVWRFMSALLQLDEIDCGSRSHLRSMTRWKDDETKAQHAAGAFARACPVEWKGTRAGSANEIVPSNR